MTATTCPYCNAVLPAAEGAGRLTCARCGESVAVDGPGIAVSPIRSSVPVAVQPEPTRSQWRLIASILAVLLLAGGAIAVWQTRFKSRPTNLVNEEAHRVVRPVDM